MQHLRWTCTGTAMEPPLLWSLDTDGRVGSLLGAVLPRGLPWRKASPEEWARVRDLGVRWCTVIDAALLAQPSVHLRLAELGVLRIPEELVVVDFRPRAEPVQGVGAYVPALTAQERLWPAARGVGARRALRDLGEAGQALVGAVHPLVVGSVYAIATVPVPFTGVAPLASHLKLDANELGKAWRRDVTKRGGPQLYQTVRAALLFRLLEHDPGSGLMSAVRAAWGIGPDRGCDIAHGLVGRTYAEVKDAAFPVLLAWLQERVVAPLVRIRARAGGRRRTSRRERKLTCRCRRLTCRRLTSRPGCCNRNVASPHWVCMPRSADRDGSVDQTKW